MLTDIISTFSIFVIEILKVIAMATKRDKRLNEKSDMT